MAHSPLLTVARRDVRDAFGDWRTVMPLVVMALILPWLLVSGVRFATRFLGEAELTQVLVPFGMLVAGFLPASFSLIGPLESFVGERERNTLESLLSAPITDRGLYLGKFLAALTPPLLSSTIAMIIYALAASQSRRSPDVAAAMTFNWFLIILGINFIKTVTMVAAAVYISAQTTSIRAANLLASFILIPMTIIVQAEALLFTNRLMLEVGLIMLVLAALSVTLVVAGMQRFNREDVLAREHSPVRGGGAALRTAISDRRHGPVVSIVRREVRDTLTDWRILTPMILLTVLMPVLAVIGTVYAKGQVEANTLETFMPFILLLVGFLPASFSLITALEVFVGEKERGSLESLFSMPITDAQLYVGKLISALVPPVGSGLIAMGLFYSGLLALGRHDLLAPLTPSRFWGLLLLTIVQTIPMVAGAVIISSHTSSVRVANLLASFVLLPMAIALQFEALLIIARRYDMIRFIGTAMVAVSVLLLRSGLQSFNRESILSREHLSLNLRGVLDDFLAFYREIRPAGVDPDRLAPTASARRFYRQELPVVWREIRLPLLIVALAVGAAIWYGATYDETQYARPITNTLMNVRRIGIVPPYNPIFNSLALFVGNSLRIFFLGLFSALTFGFITTLVPMVAFFQVAYGASYAARAGLKGGAWGFLLGYALPHGILELPAACLAAALGIRLGAALVAVPPTYSVGRHLLWGMGMYVKVFVYLVLPLLFAAALIEGFITPLVLSSIYG